MKGKEMNISFVVLLAGFFMLALSGIFIPSSCQAFDISINVSPNIINLDSDDHEFGIHTNVPYSIVNIEDQTVILVCPNDSEILPTICFADSRGYLVAKFNTSDLETYCQPVIDDYNTLMLVGETKFDPIESFAGAGDVLIIDKQARFQKGKGPNVSQKNCCLNK